MNTFECINIQLAKKLLHDDDALLVDIRAEEDYKADGEASAYHLTSANIQFFVQSTPKSKPFIIMCYHGNSSKKIAQQLADEGFVKVYSLDGGYEEWKKR